MKDFVSRKRKLSKKQDMYKTMIKMVSPADTSAGLMLKKHKQ
jgi:hypothetical protein